MSVAVFLSPYLSLHVYYLFGRMDSHIWIRPLSREIPSWDGHRLVVARGRLKYSS